jgi:hypothetical protein
MGCNFALASFPGIFDPDMTVFVVSGCIENMYFYQCCGTGSVCFWASRIWIRNRKYGSGSFHQKAIKGKKNLISTNLATFLLFICED